MFYFFFLFSCFLTTAYAHLKDPNVHAVTEGDPTADLCPFVNLLTGDFVAFEQDLVIQAVEPIIIKRVYVSGDGHGKYGGWELFPHLKLKLIPQKVKDRKGKDFRRAVVSEPSGSTFTYKLQDKNSEGWLCFRIDFEKHGKGITNISKGIISARTNIQNQTLYQVSDHIFKLFCCDGSERTYAKISSSKINPTFTLRKEKRKNGNSIIYEYDKYDRLEKITTKSPTGKIYAWCQLTYEDNALKIKTSDAKEVTYFLKKSINSIRPIKQVKSSDHAVENLLYIQPHSKIERLLNVKGSSDGRKVKVDYYTPAEVNEVRGISVKISSEEDPRADRVKTLYAPVGPRGELAAVQHFFYDVSREKIKHKKYRYTRHGRTQIFDAYGNQKEVRFSADFLPLEVKYFEGDQARLHIRTQWQSFGQLSEKKIVDHQENELLSYRYLYDDRGNILEKQLLGEITGKGKQNCARTLYTYNEDQLLTWQKDPNGKVTEYTYIPGTDLIATQFIGDDQRIWLRCFYRYNEDLILIEKIEDDGSSRNFDDLAHVTQRKIQRIKPKREHPAFGFPEEIEELVFDIQTGQETLLTKAKFTYSLHSEILQKDIYDANLSLRYSQHFQYDDMGRLVEESDALGQRTTRKFDVHGNVTDLLEVNGKRTHFSYDANNRLYEQTEFNEDNEQRTTAYKYDYNGNKIETIDSFGNSTRYSYDALGHVIEILYPASNIREKFIYDDFGRLIEKIDPLGNQIRTSYNCLNQPIEIFHPDGSKEKFSYSLDGLVKNHTNSEEITTQFEYDLLGRVVAKILVDSNENVLGKEEFEYSCFQLLSHKDLDQQVSQFIYDARGRKSFEQNPEGSFAYFYDSLGRLEKIKRTDGIHTLTTIYERDLLNRITEERQEDERGILLSKINYTYDHDGNKTSIIQSIDDKISEQQFVYDHFKRLKKSTNVFGQTTITYNENHTNDSGQRVLQKITALPNQTTIEETFDIFGHLVKTIKKDSDQKILLEEDRSYDSCGNLISVQSDVETRFEYDSMHRQTAIIQACFTAEESKIQRTYTPSGKLASLIKANRTRLNFTYDAFGHLEKLTSSDQTIAYSYRHTKQNGYLIECHDKLTNQTTIRTLDSFGRILEEKLAHGLHLKNTYDPLGRKTKLTLPDGSHIEYFYDALHLAKVKRKEIEWTFAKYDLSGNLQQQILPNHLGSIQKKYDPLGRLTTIRAPYFEQKAIGYDSLGNITQTQTNDATQNFQYDPLSQLIAENDHDYSYDERHNRIQKDQCLYEVNEKDELISTAESTYTYDDNGNPLTKTNFKGILHYQYDALDRLIEITQKHNARICFTYDGLHRRLTKTIYVWENGDWSELSHQNFFYDEQKEIGSTDNKGKIQELRILGISTHAEMGSTLLMELRGKTYLPIHDIYDNIVKLIDLDNLKVVESYQYSAFGEEKLFDEQGQTLTVSRNPWHYASKRLDPEVKLIYFGRRYYDPEVGRWMTPDPDEYTDGFNLYLYLHNNPLVLRDLYGLNSIPAENFKFDPPNKSPLLGLATYLSPELTKKHREMPCKYQIDGNDLINKGISAVNGINNTLQKARENASYLSELANRSRIYGVYFATNGLPNDFAFARKMSKQICNPQEVTFLRQIWDEFFYNSSPGSIFFQECHSGGSFIVRETLLSYPEELRKRILVLAIAPACYIEKELCRDVVHYVSKRDFLISWFTDVTSHSDVIMLDPHPNANPILDHDFMSPTFEKYIRGHLENYINKNTLW